MTKHGNFLTSARHTYAGPWPIALLGIFINLALAQLICVALLDVKWFAYDVLLGNFLGAVGIVAVAILVKRRYPNA